MPPDTSPGRRGGSGNLDQSPQFQQFLALPAYLHEEKFSQVLVAGVQSRAFFLERLLHGCGAVLQTLPFHYERLVFRLQHFDFARQLDRCLGNHNCLALARHRVWRQRHTRSRCGCACRGLGRSLEPLLLELLVQDDQLGGWLGGGGGDGGSFDGGLVEGNVAVLGVAPTVAAEDLVRALDELRVLLRFLGVERAPANAALRRRAARARRRRIW